MSITISAKDGIVSASSTDTHTPVPLNELNPEESTAVHLIFETLGETVSEAGIHVERRTDKYLSIVAYDVYDFCRLKIGKNVMWMSLSLPPEMKRTDDLRFEAGQKKNIQHWKIPLQSVSGIEKCCDLIQASYKYTIASHQKDILVKDKFNRFDSEMAVLKPNGETYFFNQDELDFIKALKLAIKSKFISDDIKIRYCDHSILDFNVNRIQLGRVKLRGKKKKIQVISREDCIWLEIQDISEAKKYISKWVSRF